MLKSSLALIQNVWRTRISGDAYLEPIIAVLYVTKQCNYSCSYCSEYGAHKNSLFRKELLNCAEILHVLRIIREGCEAIYFTGGEPLLRDDIEQIVEVSKTLLKFNYIAINTNGSLLSKREKILQHADSVVVSLDTLDVSKADKLYKVPPGTTANVIQYLSHYASLQSKLGYELVVNCVVGPESVSDANNVFDFCIKNHIQFSIQALEVNGGPHPELRTSTSFRSLVHRAITEKNKSPLRVSGSMTYLRDLSEMRPFNCLPSLNPRIDSLGRLMWPCQPLQNEIGGLVDLREHGSWNTAVSYARERFGGPPVGCQRCYLRCYAELSQLVRKPSAYAEELVSRLGEIKLW